MQNTHRIFYLIFNFTDIQVLYIFLDNIWKLSTYHTSSNCYKAINSQKQSGCLAHPVFCGDISQSVWPLENGARVYSQEINALSTLDSAARHTYGASTVHILLFSLYATPPFRSLGRIL